MMSFLGPCRPGFSVRAEPTSVPGPGAAYCAQAVLLGKNGNYAAGILEGVAHYRHEVPI